MKKNLGIEFQLRLARGTFRRVGRLRITRVNEAVFNDAFDRFFLPVITKARAVKYSLVTDAIFKQLCPSSYLSG